MVDTVCPLDDDRWRLQTSEAGADCARTNHEPDLTLPVGALGAVYLGGVPAGQLAAAGLIEATDGGIVRRLDRLLRVPLAPWPIQVF